MKKVICLLLAATILLSLCACSGGKKMKFKENVLYAGFGRADITPTISTPLGGYDSTDQRMSDRTLDSLYATCIAFTSNGETFLLLSLDAVRSHKDWTKQVREKIQNELHVPASNVMIVSTHTHSAPNTNSSHAAMGAYIQLYVEGCFNAAKAAMGDRAEATMYAGSVMTENMTFVRHYKMQDGTVAGPNFGDFSSGIAGHVGNNDPEMILYKLARKDKKDIVLMNFQAHPTLTGGATVNDISADYVGICRDKIEKDADVHFAFFLGACGNQTPNSYDAAENNTMPYADQLPSADRNYVSYGTALALYALDLLPNLTQTEGKQGIQTTSSIVTCATNKQGSDKLFEAREVVDVWEANGRDAGNAKAKEYGFASVYEAAGILGQQDNPDTYDVEVYATRIGDLCFVNAPYEMFSENALYIKANTPELTMVMTQSNHAWGYITDATAFEYKCYENFGGTFAQGSGEKLAEEMVNLLNGIK